jgi:hypothetical protein
MFIAGFHNRTYELIYGESSRIICNRQKKEDDLVKTWREMNDGMYWAHKGCKLENNNFSIIGIQVAGNEMYLNILIRDIDKIHRLYNLRTVKFQFNQMIKKLYLNFIETLLTIRVC